MSMGLKNRAAPHKIRILTVLVMVFFSYPIAFASTPSEHCSSPLTSDATTSVLNALAGPLQIEQALVESLKDEPWFPSINGVLLRYISRVVVASGMVLEVTNLQGLPQQLQFASILMSPLFRDHIMRLKIMEGSIVVTEEQLLELQEFSKHYNEVTGRLGFSFVKQWAMFCVADMKAARVDKIDLDMAWTALRKALATQNHHVGRDLEIVYRAHKIAVDMPADAALFSRKPQLSQPLSLQVSQIYAEVLAELHAQYLHLAATHYEHPLSGQTVPLNKTRLREIRTIYEQQNKQGASLMNLVLFYIPSNDLRHKTNVELLRSVQVWAATR